MHTFSDVRPIRLSRRAKPFDSPDWLFELKHDGFRGLAFVENGQCRLISRNGHAFTKFGELCTSIAESIRAETAIIDGEIVCLDGSGRSVFNDLMFRRRSGADCYFYAFDLLAVAGEDLRGLPLVERKRRLRKLVPRKKSRLLYESVCQMDLEGIVAKRKESVYRATEKPSPHWIKIKNPTYSQAEGRQEMFEELGANTRPSRRAPSFVGARTQRVHTSREHRFD
jgi:bifunctional non-homologous end joining protein LigD